ncbi:uncharacterized protein LOC119995861 [Tripterygium wilfordii]|uniref:uncharacterized protein LOC119995861 n=1 Tax=Tripterygium wilfordii TaxID=458696 RepID=UPI0018F84972|nr:uncharacterized protein LOC119995861 [Tripterygium wilfordii]
MSQQQFQLLEINLITAQDLAPVSKSMRTYAVVWVQPERKLTTRVDQNGHFNPTWNEKFVFRVDNGFLNDEESSIMIEIYAVAWLRDVLIGSVRVLISNLFDSDFGSNTRFTALQVRRPSGRPQGIINMGVALLSSTMRSMPLSTELSSTAVEFNDLMDVKTRNVNDQDNHKPKQQVIRLRRIQSDVTDRTTEETPKKCGNGGSICYGGNGSICNSSAMSISEIITTTKQKENSGSMVNGSLCNSDVGPSASVVAAAIAKGLYRTPQPQHGKENTILKNWTEQESEEGLRMKLERWKTELPPVYDHEKQRMLSKSTERRQRRRGRSESGLFSCFGNAFGCEISITCGGNSKRKVNGNGKVCHLSSVDGNYSQSFI